MKFFIQRNPGHSGGWWFLKVCNLHPDVLVYGELSGSDGPPGVWNGDYATSDERLVGFLQGVEKSGSCESLGLVKAHTGGADKFCREHGGRIVQVVRNPIAILAEKDRSYWAAVQNDKMPSHLTAHLSYLEGALGRPVETQRDHFEGMLHWTSRPEGVFWKFIHKREKWVTVRLEDLNFSLGTDMHLFRRFMEYVTQVKWSRDLVARVRDEMPPNEGEEADAMSTWHGSRGEYEWFYDPTPVREWQGWDREQRELFVQLFCEIMMRLGYGWPELQP